MSLHRKLLAAVVVAFAVAPTIGSASTVAVDRALPTQNLNNSAGGSRSNVAWGYSQSQAPGYWIGDSFNLGSNSNIDQLTAWVITPEGSDFGATYSNLSLYLGTASSGQLNKVASTNISGNSTTNANISVSKVAYDNGEQYQGYSGSYRQLWEIDFNNLGSYSQGDYLFALTGLTPDYTLFMHSSNAALGGAPADGADNLISYFYGANGGATLAYGGSFDTKGNGWDKSSDVNLRVVTSPVPIPASFPLLLTVIGGSAVMLRRKKMQKANHA